MFVLFFVLIIFVEIRNGDEQP